MPKPERSEGEGEGSNEMRASFDAAVLNSVSQVDLKFAAEGL